MCMFPFTIYDLMIFLSDCKQREGIILCLLKKNYGHILNDCKNHKYLADGNSSLIAFVACKDASFD